MGTILDKIRKALAEHAGHRVGFSWLYNSTFCEDCDTWLEPKEHEKRPEKPSQRVPVNPPKDSPSESSPPAPGATKGPSGS